MAFFFLLNGLATLLIIGCDCGDDFVLCFLSNPLIRNTYGDTEIYLTSDVNGASVTATSGIEGVNQTVLLGQKNERFTLQVNSTQSRVKLNAIEQKGIMISSPDSIYLLGFNNIRGTSAEVFIPRSVSQLGFFYVALTYCQSPAKCLISIAAVLERVNITVYIPAQFTGFVDFYGTSYRACDVLQMTLQPLQTVQIATQADITGMLISSDRNIAAFAGADKTRTYSDDARNHLAASLPPLIQWGNFYIVVRDNSELYPDVIKVISSKDNTTVLLRGCGSNTFLLQHAFQDHFNHSFTCEYMEISAENDILVSHFVIRTEWQNAGMYYPVPLGQFARKYVVPLSTFYTDCQLSIVARDGEQYNILVQDTSISAQWTPVLLSPYIVTTVAVSNTEVLKVQTISHATFGGHLTCFSLYTAAATALLPKDINIFTIPDYGNIPSQESIPGVLKCEDSTSTTQTPTPDVTTTIATTTPDVTTTIPTTTPDVSTTIQTPIPDVTTTISTTTPDVTTTIPTTTPDVTTTIPTTTPDVTTTIPTTTADVTTTTPTTTPDATTSIPTTTPNATTTIPTTTPDVTTTIPTTTPNVTTTIPTTTPDATTTTPTTTPDVTTALQIITCTPDSNLSTSNTCFCRRDNVPREIASTDVFLEQYSEHIQATLTIRRNETVRWQRKLTSADDSRESSQIIGYVGVLVIGVTVGILMLPDLCNLYQYIQT